MSGDNLSVVLFVDGDLHVSFVLIRGGEDRDVWVWTHSADALGVEACVDGVNESQVSEVVDIDSVLKDNHHSKIGKELIKDCNK
jgi:hypothetical protein